MIVSFWQQRCYCFKTSSCQESLTFDLRRNIRLAALKLTCIYVHRAQDERLEVDRGRGSLLMFEFGLLQVLSESLLVTGVLQQT